MLSPSKKPWLGVLVAVLTVIPGIVKSAPEVLKERETRSGQAKKIIEKKVLVVGINEGYAPFAMYPDIYGDGKSNGNATNKDRLVGIDVDIARLIAAELGARVMFVKPVRDDQHISLLRAGVTDMIIATMPRLPSLGLKVNFTDPYFEISQAALIRKDFQGIETASSLYDLFDVPGIRVGVKKNSSGERFAHAVFEGDKIRAFETHSSLTNALLAGEVDAHIHESPFVQIWAKAHPEHAQLVRPLLEPVTREHYAIAIPMGDPDFLSWLNMFIDKLRSDGTMDLLIHRYFVDMDWSGVTGEDKIDTMKADLQRVSAVIKKLKKEGRIKLYK